MTKLYSSNTVVELTGVTHRQLQSWDEKKIVRPVRRAKVGMTGRPDSRLYSNEQLYLMRWILMMRDYGFTPKTAIPTIRRFKQAGLGLKQVSHFLQVLRGRKNSRISWRKPRK